MQSKRKHVSGTATNEFNGKMSLPPARLEEIDPEIAVLHAKNTASLSKKFMEELKDQGMHIIAISKFLTSVRVKLRNCWHIVYQYSVYILLLSKLKQLKKNDHRQLNNLEIPTCTQRPSEVRTCLKYCNVQSSFVSKLSIGTWFHSCSTFVRPHSSVVLV